MFDKIAEAILGNYPDNSQARELEILCRILALIILGAVIYFLLKRKIPILLSIKWFIRFLY